MAGHREVVLTGIHLGRYKSEAAGQGGLPGLLDALAPVFDRHRQCRLRLSSIEPLEFAETLRRCIARHSWICRHFHIPLQSCDDAVLAAMGRPYTSKQGLSAIQAVARDFPQAAIGSDLLVGFPGENDLAARRTLEAIRDSAVSHVHVFTFSPARAPARPTWTRRCLPRSWPSGPRRCESLARSSGAPFSIEEWSTHDMVIDKVGLEFAVGLTQHYRRLRIPLTIPSQDDDRVLAPGQRLWAMAEGMDDDGLLGRPITEPLSKKAAHRCRLKWTNDY